jgi:alkanesulfonate monooxygenase SsuD/methylene tetrahydromethanopterin reductase-like flavin-dependent oxidoreductase (luciferase family)
MEFLVIGRFIDTPIVPPQQELAMLKATFEGFAAKQDRRIKAVYPLTDQRATALVVDVETADDLGRLIMSLPASRLSTFEAHPIGTPEAVVEQLQQWERALPR